MTTNFTFDPKAHVYTLDGKPMTGMTTILGVLGKPALVPWAARMACDYIREHCTQIKFEGDLLHYEVTEEKLKEAQVAHAKKKTDAASKGTDTHALVEEYVEFCIEYKGGAASNIDEDRYLPIADFIAWAIKENIRFLASELQVYSRSLWVAGTMDFLFEKDGKKYIGDLKTYKKLWDRVPMFQCAGYAYLYQEMKAEKLAEKIYSERGYNKLFSEEEGRSHARIESRQETRNLIAGYVVFNLPKERPHDPLEDVKWSFDTEGDTKAFLACVELYRQLANWK